MTGEARGRGFTLIEVLVALAIFSILLAALYGTLIISQRAVVTADGSLVLLHELRTTLDLMRREVEASLPGGSGFRVRDREIFGRQASQIELVTFASPSPGPLRVSYRVEEDEDRLVLVKSASLAHLEETGRSEAGMLDVVSFDIETFDGSRWLRTWDEDKLPSAIRISVSAPYRDGEISLTETVRPKAGGRV